jgi:Fe-Mn family superoxide dismutase
MKKEERRSMSNWNEQANGTDAVMDEQPMARREFLKMAAAVGGTALALSQMRLTAGAADAKKQTVKAAALMGKGIPADHPLHHYDATASIQAKTFPALASVEGITQNQLNQHLELYNGYVKKINDIEKQIAAIPADELSQANSAYSPFRELHLEQSYALNGVVLHEYYFENLGGGKKQPTETDMLHSVITQEFGSWENYISHVTAVGKSARGWALTGYNMRDHRVHNYGLDLHNQGVPVNVIPILVLDVYEHAYMIDFGTKRPAYIEAFFRNVNWQVADERLKTMLLHG